MKRVRFTFEMVVGWPASQDRAAGRLRRRFNAAIRAMKTGPGRMVGGDLSTLKETVETFERLASIVRRARASAFNAEGSDDGDGDGEGGGGDGDGPDAGQA